MRIQIVGTSGSGKSTYADRLATLTGYSRIEIDDLKFEPGWVQRSDQDLDADLSAAIASDNWIACGNYFSSSAKIHDKADYIVWLKYPLWKVLWRVTGRTFRRIWTKEPVCNGNVESFWMQFFTSKSIYVWVFKSYNKRLKLFTKLSSDPQYQHKWIIVTNDKQVKESLKRLTALSNSNFF